MDTRIKIKEEEPRSDDIFSQNETEFFHNIVSIKTNSDGDDCDVVVKTEIKSETLFNEHCINQIRFETVTLSSSTNWELDRKTETEKQTLVSDFGSQNKGSEFLPEDPVTKDEEYNGGEEVDNRVEIKEEPHWLETPASSVCGETGDGDFPPIQVTSSRLCAEAVPGKSPLPPAEDSGRKTSFYNGKYHLECEHQKGDVTEMQTAEGHFLSEKTGEYSNEGELYVMPLHLKQDTVIHKGKMAHQCKTCNRSFTHLSNLKTHNLIHEGKKPHQCKICNKSFTHLTNLKTHNLIHEGKKPHQCKTCNKGFTQLSALKKHHLIHEGIKPHQCKTCDKRFTQAAQLTTHELIHEGKKPHQCNICHKRFTRLSAMKRHNLIHEGKKPHQCKICDKSFTQLSHLKTHYLIHEGKKPHQCETCDKSFTQLSHLRRHNVMHEGKR